MQNDEVTWNILNEGFCQYKTQSKTERMCRNEFNLTGMCSRNACPLANSQYATVREEEGICYLYMKVVERSHFPSRMWEKIKLSRNRAKAEQQIEEQLIYWPVFIRHKCKRRLLRIHQYLARMRKLELSTQKKIVPLNKRVERRERTRERKALIASKIDSAIEKELLGRLKDGVYGGLYQFKKKDTETQELESESESESEAELEEEHEMDAEDLRSREFVEDFEESDSDIEDTHTGGDGGSSDSETELGEESTERSRAHRLMKRPHVEIEYEHEIEPNKRERLRN